MLRPLKSEAAANSPARPAAVLAGPQANRLCPGPGAVEMGQRAVILEDMQPLRRSGSTQRWAPQFFLALNQDVGHGWALKTAIRRSRVVLPQPDASRPTSSPGAG